jgi:uncharacterized protein
VSAFDDEFGLFSETVVDEPESFDSGQERRKAAPAKPSDEAHAERSRGGQGRRASRTPSDEAYSSQGRPFDSAQGRRVGRERKPNAPSTDPWAGHRRATELLQFLARKLVQKPDAVSVELFIDEESQPVIELVVDPEDLGKVIGRSGRVAQALRTVVRATAESRVAVDILDTNEAAEDL